MNELNEAAASLTYAACCLYLKRNGWSREEPDSGWWWRHGQRDMLKLGEAVETQLVKDGVDVRLEPAY